MIKEKNKWYITLGGTKITEESADRVIIEGQEDEAGTDADAEGEEGDFPPDHINKEKLEELLTELFS